jgi:hypothetical protein
MAPPKDDGLFSHVRCYVTGCLIASYAWAIPESGLILSTSIISGPTIAGGALKCHPNYTSGNNGNREMI